jgi:DNA invertase Pin-like site-specific DNA recombinase
LSPHQQKEIIDAIASGAKTPAAGARLFNVHRSTVLRLLARA